jgi:type I site-specific restriction-modification system R (restriction) subunit
VFLSCDYGRWYATQQQDILADTITCKTNNILNKEINPDVLILINGIPILLRSNIKISSDYIDGIDIINYIKKQ